MFFTGNLMINKIKLRKSLAVFLMLSMAGCNVNPHDPASTLNDAALRFDAGGVIQAGGQVYSLGDYTTIEIPSDKLFDTNSADFLEGAPIILDSAVAILKRSPSFNVLISGNMSGFSSSHFEHQLSENRARQVASYFWTKDISGFRDQSLIPRKLTYVGYGNYFPIANTYSNASIRENSRIQITIYPQKDQLILDKKQRAFNNVGAFNEPHPAPSGPSANKGLADNAFPENEKINAEFQDAATTTPPLATAPASVLPSAAPSTADSFPLYDDKPSK